MEVFIVNVQPRTAEIGIEIYGIYESEDDARKKADELNRGADPLDSVYYGVRPYNVIPKKILSPAT